MNRRSPAMSAVLHIAAIIVIAFPAAGHAADPNLMVSRHAGDVRLQRNGDWFALPIRAEIAPGERVVTQAGARVALTLGEHTEMVIGQSSSVRVHSTFPATPPARAERANIVLEVGRVSIDARTEQGQVPPDIRLNAGDLKLRIFGASVWVEKDAQQTESCLLAGAVELLAPGGKNYRLDEPGSCLVLRGSQVITATRSQVGSLSRRLARTSFPSDAALREEARLAGLGRERSAPAAAAPTTTPQPTVPPRKTASAPAQPTASDGGWALVLGSFGTQQAATRQADQLRKQGLEVRVAQARNAAGVETWRLLSGHYATKAEADIALPQARGLPGLSGAWITREP